VTLNLDIKQLATEIAAAMPNRLPRFLSLQQVAEVLSCSPDHVRSFIASGELAAIDIGNAEKKQIRVPEDSLQEFAARRKVVG
jgi:excisionase family DNA binding protein